MSTYTLHVETQDPKSGLRGRRSVGGGKTLADAQANTGKVFDRDPGVTEIVVSGPVDDAGTVGEIERVGRPS